jgi:hypothetical protein
MNPSSAIFDIFRRGRLADRETPPVDLAERVRVLQDLGDFPPEACIEALRNSFYDVNRACNALIRDTRRAETA